MKEPYKTYGKMAGILVLPTAFVLGILFAASLVHAETWNFVCSDFTQGETYSCDGDDLVLSTAEAYAYTDDGTLIFPEGETVYVSFTADGTGDGYAMIWGTASGSSAQEDWTAGEVVALPITVPTGNSKNALWIRNIPDFDGSISDICVTDVEGECEGVVEPPPESEETASTTALAAQAQSNIFYGYVIFFMFMIFPIWLLRRN